MTYQTTITRKGQITIPKDIRDILRLDEGRKLEIEFERIKGEIKIKSAPDILDLAGMFKPKKKINVLRAREAMEKNYERV
ncbi:MAG: AbrB/MazE/SpoVT family DNA-binding domain-containing protein [Patescibacteria group bacterium]